MAKLQEIFAQPEVVLPCLSRAVERRRQAQQTAELPRASLIARIARLRGALDDLLSRELECSHPEEQASIARVRVQKRAEIDALTARLNAPERPLPLPDPAWLSERLETIRNGFLGAWEALPENEKRRLVNAGILRIEALCEKVPGVRLWRREVVSVEVQPWLLNVRE